MDLQHKESPLFKPGLPTAMVQLVMETDRILQKSSAEVISTLCLARVGGPGQQDLSSGEGRDLTATWPCQVSAGAHTMVTRCSRGYVKAGANGIRGHSTLLPQLSALPCASCPGLWCCCVLLLPLQHPHSSQSHPSSSASSSATLSLCCHRSLHGNSHSGRWKILVRLLTHKTKQGPD